MTYRVLQFHRRVFSNLVFFLNLVEIRPKKLFEKKIMTPKVNFGRNFLKIFEKMAKEIHFFLSNKIHLLG